MSARRANPREDSDFVGTSQVFFICYNILGLYTNSSCLLRFFLFIMTTNLLHKKRAPWENDPLRLPTLRLCNDPLCILQRRKPEPSLPSCSADTLGRRLHPLSFNAISLAFEAPYALLLSRKEGVYSFDTSIQLLENPSISCSFFVSFSVSPKEVQPCV